MKLVGQLKVFEAKQSVIFPKFIKVNELSKKKTELVRRHKMTWPNLYKQSLKK